MTLAEFTKRIPASASAKLSDATLELWCSIHAYVTEHGQTDRFDSVLRKKIREARDKWISEPTLQRHLKRMADAGLLQAHRILVKPNAFGKLLGGLGSLVFADSPPAGLFIRYTLPGMTPTLKDNDDESSVNQETA